MSSATALQSSSIGSVNRIRPWRKSTSPRAGDGSHRAFGRAGRRYAAGVRAGRRCLCVCIAGSLRALPFGAPPWRGHTGSERQYPSGQPSEPTISSIPSNYFDADPKEGPVGLRFVLRSDDWKPTDSELGRSRREIVLRWPNVLYAIWDHVHPRLLRDLKTSGRCTGCGSEQGQIVAPVRAQCRPA